MHLRASQDRRCVLRYLVLPSSGIVGRKALPASVCKHVQPRKRSISSKTLLDCWVVSGSKLRINALVFHHSRKQWKSCSPSRAHPAKWTWYGFCNSISIGYLYIQERKIAPVHWIVTYVCIASAVHTLGLLCAQWRPQSVSNPSHTKPYHWPLQAMADFGRPKYGGYLV